MNQQAVVQQPDSDIPPYVQGTPKQNLLFGAAFVLAAIVLYLVLWLRKRRK
jgi:hypothetical protein